MTEVQLNNIVEANEDESDGSTAIEFKSREPQKTPMKIFSAFDENYITDTPYSSIRKPKSHSRIRPTTIHFSQNTNQMSADSPSAITSYEESRGRFIDSNSHRNHEARNSPAVNSQTLVALDITPKMDEITARVEKRKVVKSAFPSTLVGNFDNQDASAKHKSMSSNAAKKVMDWFRKKSLGSQHGATYQHNSLPISGHRGSISMFQESTLRMHRGAIDQNAVTSRAPIEIFHNIKQTLSAIGIEVKKETDMKLKCTRRKRKVRSGSVTTIKSTTSHMSTDTQTTANTATTNMTGHTNITNCSNAISPTPGYNSASHSARRRTVSAFSRLLKLGMHQEGCDYSNEYPTPSVSTFGTPHIQPEPICVNMHSCLSLYFGSSASL
ncbi:hypothetical protein K7432_018384 [Basidiobolus ranarum]|uniref:Uncharacterized protein n=1 Tax=Basidiobolus ranarum TaxID=34480 RepID=A0ABR2WC96_9FUNG